MKSITPQFDTIDEYKFYDLNTYKWNFDNDSKSIEHNKSIIEQLSLDFSELSGIPFETVVKAFDIDYITTRRTENLILLYSNGGSNEVYYYFLNINTETYRTLNKF